MCALAPTAFASEPSFQDLKKLDIVDSYTTYGAESKNGNEFYIFVDGGNKDGQIASINLTSAFGGYPGFEFYRSQCADRTVRKLDTANKVLGEAVPVAKFNGVSQMAAYISCMADIAEEVYKKN